MFILEHKQLFRFSSDFDKISSWKIIHFIQLLNFALGRGGKCRLLFFLWFFPLIALCTRVYLWLASQRICFHLWCSKNLLGFIHYFLFCLFSDPLMSAFNIINFFFYFSSIFYFSNMFTQMLTWFIFIIYFLDIRINMHFAAWWQPL